MNIFNKIILVIILLFFIFVSFVSIANEFVGFFKWSEIANKVFNPNDQYKSLCINPGTFDGNSYLCFLVFT